jgi:hypothetical protein
MKFGEAPKTCFVFMFLSSFHQPIFSLASNPDPDKLLYSFVTPGEV